MTITIPDWLPMFLLFVATCFNMWFAYWLRDEAHKKLAKFEAMLSGWNKAATEAQALWDYGAQSEAIRVLEEAGAVKKPSAR